MASPLIAPPCYECAAACHLRVPVFTEVSASDNKENTNGNSGSRQFGALGKKLQVKKVDPAEVFLKVCKNIDFTF